MLADAIKVINNSNLSLLFSIGTILFLFFKFYIRVGTHTHFHQVWMTREERYKSSILKVLFGSLAFNGGFLALGFLSLQYPMKNQSNQATLNTGGYVLVGVLAIICIVYILLFFLAVFYKKIQKISGSISKKRIRAIAKILTVCGLIGTVIIYFLFVSIFLVFLIYEKAIDLSEIIKISIFLLIITIALYFLFFELLPTQLELKKEYKVSYKRVPRETDEIKQDPMYLYFSLSDKYLIFGDKQNEAESTVYYVYDKEKEKFMQLQKEKNEQ